MFRASGALVPGDLNLNQLKAFYYAAMCSSITVAAERLFITQPAVSMQVKGLEEQFGVQLFIRKKKKLELTDAGKNLFQIAKKIRKFILDKRNQRGYYGGMIQN